MTDANAKLRRLREWLRLQRVRGLWPFVTADDAIAECDRMLAEPEPAKPEPLAMACKAPSGCCVAVASTDGSWCPQGCFPGTGRYSWRNARGVLAPEPPRRETLEQEVARLYGLVGPDGKGRP